MMLVLVTLLPLQVFCIRMVTNSLLQIKFYLCLNICNIKKHLLRELQNTKCAVL